MPDLSWMRIRLMPSPPSEDSDQAPALVLLHKRTIVELKIGGEPVWSQRIAPPVSISSIRTVEGDTQLVGEEAARALALRRGLQLMLPYRCKRDWYLQAKVLGSNRQELLVLNEKVHWSLEVSSTKPSSERAATPSRP